MFLDKLVAQLGTTDFWEGWPWVFMLAEMSVACLRLYSPLTDEFINSNL